MKNLLIIFSMFCISCSNKDIVVQESKRNCSCSEIIEDKYNAEVRDFVFEHGNAFGPGSFDCDPPFRSFGEGLGPKNDKLFNQTHTMELKNISQTKVYKVVVQINTNGQVEYQDYEIQPTETIQLGCDKKIDVTFVYGDNPYPWDALKISNLSKYDIEYKVHKVSLISEY